MSRLRFFTDLRQKNMMFFSRQIRQCKYTKTLKNIRMFSVGRALVDGVCECRAANA